MRLGVHAGAFMEKGLCMCAPSMQGRVQSFKTEKTCKTLCPCLAWLVGRGKIHASVTTLTWRMCARLRVAMSHKVMHG